jgi:hypothetical protein
LYFRICTLVVVNDIKDKKIIRLQFSNTARDILYYVSVGAVLSMGRCANATMQEFAPLFYILATDVKK